MNIEDKKFYGTTTVGTKGQVVLPMALRRDLNIQPGDKIAVLVLKRDGMEGVVMVKSNILTSIVEEFFGGKIE